MFFIPQKYANDDTKHTVLQDHKQPRHRVAVLFACFVYNHFLPSLNSTPNQLEDSVKPRVAPMVVSAVLSLPRGHFLLRLLSIQSRAPAADQSSSRPASQTSGGVIACQSCLRACFFPPRRHAPDKKHIFTHKNEITGNLRAKELWRRRRLAIELSESMNSSHPRLCIRWTSKRWRR